LGRKSRAQQRHKSKERNECDFMFHDSHLTFNNSSLPRKDASGE
jgi:hypothetical protein